METSKNEDPNKITINDQNFQKVGNMNSEPTGLQHAPKNYDLYRDTESGAVMGKLSENHPSEALYWEKKMEALPLDLSQLSSAEVVRILRNPSVKIYGGVSGFAKLKDGKYLPEHINFEKSELVVIEEGHPLSGYNYYIQVKNTFDDCKVTIDRKNPDISYSKNTITLRDGMNTATFSFYEIPEGYQELVEKKKASE